MYTGFVKFLGDIKVFNPGLYLSRHDFTGYHFLKIREGGQIFSHKRSEDKINLAATHNISRAVYPASELTTVS